MQAREIDTREFPGYDYEWETQSLKNNGVWHTTLGPIIVWGGDEAYVFRQGRKLQRGGHLIARIRPFMGLDRGDLVEMDLEIQDVDGIPLADPISFHKEVMTAYNAYHPMITLDHPVDRILVATTCRVTGPNMAFTTEELVREGRPSRLSARAHWGLWIYPGA